MKNKVGVIVDSSCGIKKKEAIKKGFYFLPIIIDFNGEERESGVNIDNEFLYKNMTKNTPVKTAAIRFGEMEETFKKALQENEKVIFISLSKHLSSINSTAISIARNLGDENLIIWDSEFLTPWLNKLLDPLSKLLKKNANIEDFETALSFYDKKMFAYIFPESLDFLYSGGRISKTQYLLASSLKIFPIVTISNGKLTDYPIIKKRSVKKTIAELIVKLKERIQILEDEGIRNWEIKIVSVNSKEKDLLYEKIKEEFGIDKDKIEELNLAPAIIAHLGPKALGVGVIESIKVLEKKLNI